jgi:hypothetical protein
MESSRVCSAPLVTRIRAVRVSTGVERMISAGTGEVVSIHREAVNLRLDHELVALTCVGLGGLPNGIQVEASFDPIRLGLEPGLAVRTGEASGLVIEGRLRIDLAGTPRWSPRIRALATAPRDLRHRLALANAAIAANGPNGLHGLVDARDRAAELALALASGDREAAIGAGRRLVGLGAGLTPAGDDLLVGLSSALARLGDPWAQPLAAGWASATRDGTTPVAAAFHLHAARGEYSERLHDVLAAILLGRPDSIGAAVTRASAWGATSGRDARLGIAMGLEVAARRLERPAQ